MMYLLDTDIISNLMKPSPTIGLIARMAEVPVHQQFTSSITLGELIYGALKKRDRSTALLDQIESRLLPNLEVLPFDDSAAKRYGAVRANLELRGNTIGDADLRIASIALARDLVVVTGNVRHFSRIPELKVENWLREGFRRE